MPVLREELIVDRPLQEVWEFISDFANSEAWDPGVASARKVTEGDVRVGTRYALQVVFNGKEMPMTYEVTEYEPTRRVVLHGDGSPITAVDDIRFTATPEGGTKITEQLAPVFRTASWTVLNTGKPSMVVPPLPGVIPPTMLVPYSRQAMAWKVPCFPRP